MSGSGNLGRVLAGIDLSQARPGSGLLSIIPPEMFQQGYQQVQKPNYSYDEEYTPPSNNIPNSDIPTPRRQLRRDLYDIVPASTRININDPANDEMKAHWRDYANRGIIFNSRVKQLGRPDPIPVYYSNFRHESLPYYPGDEYSDHIFNQFKGELHSEMPREMKNLLDTVYSRDKKLLKNIAKNPAFYDNDAYNRNVLYYDHLAPMLGETDDSDRDHIDKLAYTLMDNAPTYLANKKLEKLGSKERLPYGAALHPDTFLDIMGISAKKFRQAQAQAQAQAQRPPKIEQPKPPVQTTAPSPQTKPRNPLPGYEDVSGLSFHQSALDRTVFSSSSGETSLLFGETSPSQIFKTSSSIESTIAPITPSRSQSSIHDLPYDWAEGSQNKPSKTSTPPQKPPVVTKTSTPPQTKNRVDFGDIGNSGAPQRIRHNLSSTIYSLSTPGYLNFSNPYPTPVETPYPARLINPKIDPATAQGNLRTYNQLMMRREINSIADSESALQTQIQINRQNAATQLKQQVKDIAYGLKKTLGSKRLRGLDKEAKEAIAKTLIAPRSFHFMVERGGGFTNPNAENPRQVVGHQQMLEHWKISKRGEVKLKGFDVVEATNAQIALQNIAPRRAALAQYIDTANWHSRDKEITNIQKNLSKFRDRFNFERYGAPSDVHAANQQNKSAARRSARHYAFGSYPEDYNDVLAKILNTKRGKY